MSALSAPSRRVAGVVLWPLAVGSLLHLLVRSAAGDASDLEIFWRSAASFAAGGPLYDPLREFIYPPLAGWLLAPLGLLPFRAACVVVAVLGTAAVVASTLVLLRLVGVHRGSPVVPGALLLVATSQPVVGLLDQGNIDVVLLLAETGVIALLLAHRPLAAGALLGAVCAVKPTLAPVLLVLLLLGRVRAAVAAVVVGLGLTALGLVTVQDGAVFFRDVLPLLAEGNRDVLDQYDRSLDGAAAHLGLPAPLTLALRAGVLALACAVVWRRRHGPMAPLEAVPLVMLGTIIASSFSWTNYGIYLLPLLVTVALPGSLVRTWPAWAGAYLFAAPDAWNIPGVDGAAATALDLNPLWGWLLLLGACAGTALRHPGHLGRPDQTARPPEGEPRDRRPDPAQRVGAHVPHDRDAAPDRG